MSVVVAAVSVAVLASAAAAAPAELAISAQPSVAAPEQPVVLFGTAAGAGPGDVVDVEARDCGQRSFRFAVSAHVGPSGRWSIQLPGRREQAAPALAASG